MLGALGTKLLTTIQQAVCCLAKRGESCEAPVFVRNCAGTGTPDVAFSVAVFLTNAAVPVTLPFSEATSMEVENFSTNDFLGVELSNEQTFYVPPGGSKVIAFSTPSTILGGNVTLTPAADAEGTPGTGACHAQITLINQP